ncbi:MAG TPA: hypothetical protein VD947_03800 [Patescibacteria group bacterium]|nr:hypothetical protein [Patescibacteria group bacterium]
MSGVRDVGPEGAVHVLKKVGDSLSVDFLKFRGLNVKVGDLAFLILVDTGRVDGNNLRAVENQGYNARTIPRLDSSLKDELDRNSDNHIGAALHPGDRIIIGSEEGFQIHRGPSGVSIDPRRTQQVVGNGVVQKALAADQKIRPQHTEIRVASPEAVIVSHVGPEVAEPEGTAIELIPLRKQG